LLGLTLSDSAQNSAASRHKNLDLTGFSAPKAQLRTYITCTLKKQPIAMKPRRCQKII